MPSIDQINISGELTGSDRFLIYDRETGSSRTVTANTALSYYLVEIINSGQIKTVTNIDYVNEFVVLTFSDGSTKQAGPIAGGGGNGQILINGSQVSEILTGAGIHAEHNPSTNKTTLSTISTYSVGNYFVGIYEALADLIAAVPNPANNYQAIVITPSEKYYHSVGSTWVEMANVPDVHPEYLGAYTTVQSLEVANPSAQDESIAIVGPEGGRAFYIKLSGQWVLIMGSDLVSLTSRMSVLEQSRTTMANDIAILDQSVNSKISGIHIENAQGPAFDDINSLNLIGLVAEDEQSQSVTLRVLPSMKVNDGTNNFSSLDKLKFPGATITTENQGKTAVIVQSAAKSLVNKVGGDSVPDVIQFRFDGAGVTVSPVVGQPGVADINIPGTPLASFSVSNGATTISDVTNIDFITSRIGGGQQQGTVVITPYIELSKFLGALGDEGSVDSIRYKYPLTADIAPITPNAAVLRLADDSVEPHAGAELLASSDREVVLVKNVLNDGTTFSGALRFDETVYSNSNRVSYSKPQRAFTISGVEGATINYLLWARVALLRNADVDGAVKVSLLDVTENLSVSSPVNESIIPDIDGNLMSSLTHYKAGDPLGSIDLIGIVPVDENGLTFVVNVEDTLTKPLHVADRTDGSTGMLISEIKAASKTGPARAQFQIDTELGVRVLTKTYSGDVGESNWAFRIPRPPTNKTAGDAVFFDIGTAMAVLTPITFDVTGGVLNVAAQSGQVDFDAAVTRIFTHIDTVVLRNKQLTASITVPATEFPLVVTALGWVGAADGFDFPLYATRGGQQPPLEADWEVLSFVEASAGTTTMDFVAGNQHENLAVMIFPKFHTGGISYSLSDFRILLQDSFTTYKINQVGTREKTTLTDASVNMGAFSLKELRYTLAAENDPAGNRLPCGVVDTGYDIIKVDSTVNPATYKGNSILGVGALKFLESGTATFKTTVHAYTTAGVGAVAHATFWWAKADPQLPGPTYTEQKIIDSETEIGMLGGVEIRQEHELRTFTVSVTAGDLFVFRGFSEVAGQVYIKATSSADYSMHTDIKFISVP